MKFVSVEQSGAIATVRFDRGEPSNLLSFQLMRELTAVARQFEDDQHTAAIVLCGRSDNFSLGFDLKDPETRKIRSASLDEVTNALAIGARMCRAWEDLAPLTICAMEGWCVGGGVALAVATDLRVMDQAGGLYVPEVERGFNMSWGSLPRIVNLVGPARAKRLVALAQKLDANAAQNWGLVDQLASHGAVVDAAMKFANRAAAMPLSALRMCKRDINAYANALAAPTSHADQDGFALLQASEDSQEAIQAFLEKRAPKFRRD